MKVSPNTPFRFSASLIYCSPHLYVFDHNLLLPPSPSIHQGWSGVGLHLFAMRRVHAAAVPRGLGHDEDQRKAMEDEILRLKESVEALKASRNELEAEKRGMHLQHKKVVDLVKGRQVADLEAIPPEFLTKDKGIEKYIAQLQQKVEGLKRTNRKVTDANTKLREKIKTASRGTVPSRVMQPRAHHAAQPPPALRAVSSSSGSRTAARGASATPAAAAASAADLNRHVGVGTSPAASAAAAAGTSSPLASSVGPSRGAAQQPSLHIQQVLSPEWQALDTTPAERPHSATLPASGAKAVSFGTALGSGSTAAAAAAGATAEAPFALERDASSLRQPSRPHPHPQQAPLQKQPSSAVLMGEAAMRGPPLPAAATAAVPAAHKRRDILQNFADAGVVRSSSAAAAGDQRSSAAALESARLDELFGRSEHAMAEKTSVIFHLETLVVGLKEQLEASEAAILGLQDEVLKYKVERDEAVKGRDLNTREKDVCLEERDYAIRAKAKLEADLLLCADEIELLRRDRERIRDDYDAACARSRGERTRCDQLEGQQLEAFEELQQTLKEKTAALLVLDTRHRESEEKARALHSANVDMLEEMQRLSAQLGKERIASRGRDAEMERLRLDLEGVDARDEQHRRLREEYVILQREHTATLDKILSARNVGDVEVRREAAAEVAQLKQAVSKWEAASKTQFKQYQSTLLKLKDATDRAEALQKENGTLGCRVAGLEADKQHLENKVKLLFMYKREVEGMPAGGSGDGEAGEADGHLDEERVSEIVMAMEIVQRSKGMLGMKDMVRQLTGEEREDALVDLQGTNEQLQRDLMLLHKTNKQLKERMATQEVDARRQVSLSGLKAKGVNERSAAAQDASRRVIEKQAAQIDNLSRTIRSVVRYGAPAFAPPTPSGAGSPGAGSSVPSITSTLSLESAVGPNDNVLQISFRFAHFVSEDVARLFASAADGGDAQPAILASLDFLDFETVATQEHFLRTRAPPPAEDRVNACVLPDPVDFDSHFIFKVAESDDLLRYLSTKGCAVRLRRRGGGGADDVVANGLLSCCALLGSETRRFAQGRLALHAPSTQAHHRGAVLAYLDVVAKLKRPLAFASVADARIRFPVPAFAARGLDAIDNADAAEREEATGDGRGLARPGTAAGAPAILPVSVEVAAQERLADVVGLRVRLTDVALERPARCSVFTSFNGVDVWFAQCGAEPTRTPGFGASDVDPAADRVVEAFPAEQRPLLEALFAGGLPLVLFDDTEPEVTDCVGSASVPTRALLERPVGHRLEAGVTFVSSAGVPAGTAQVSLEWQLRAQPPSCAGSPAAGVLSAEDGKGDAAC